MGGGCTKPQGKEAWSPLSPTRLPLIPLKNAKGTKFQKWGAMGKKRGCPSVGFPPVIVPDDCSTTGEVLL